MELTRLKGTSRRTQQQLELEIENMGAHLNAYTSVSLHVILYFSRHAEADFVCPA